MNSYYSDRWVTIYHGDCLKIMPQLDAESSDMILSDLPYGVTARNRWDNVLPFNLLWQQYERIIKLHGAIALTAVQPFSSHLVMSNLKLFRYSLVWHKTTPTGYLNANRMPLRAHEDILIFYKKLPVYNPRMTSGHMRKVSKAEHKRNCVRTTDYGLHGLTTYDSTDRFPTSALTFSTDKQKEALHPTQKPVALMQYLIETYTNKGDVVLDNCLGSGTTAVACIKTGHHCIGIEIEEKYCEIAARRCSQEVMELGI